METPNVPVEINPPMGEELVLVAHATGFQIYICRTDAAGQPAWVLKAPEALLYDQRGGLVGKHFAGPTWKHSDGSEISAKMATKVDAPDGSAIPWLLLKVSGRTGSGAFSRITTIQRINTVGGLAPASMCSANGLESEFKSSYSADYYFYAARE